MENKVRKMLRKNAIDVAGWRAPVPLPEIEFCLLLCVSEVRKLFARHLHTHENDCLVSGYSCQSTGGFFVVLRRFFHSGLVGKMAEG